MNDIIIHNVVKRLGQEKIETIRLLSEYFIEKGFNKFKAPELAENNLNIFLEYVNNHIYFYNKKGIVCLFKSISNKNVTFIDFGFFEVQNINDRLLSEINDRQFEFVCANILKKCFNAQKAHSNKGKSDGGFDFYGMINQKENLHDDSIINIEIFGQAKQYSSTITRPEIDKFVGFIERNRTLRKYKPTLYIFATTSDFSVGASNFDAEYGIVCLNGLQISSILYRQILTEKKSIDEGLKDFIEEI